MIWIINQVNAGNMDPVTASDLFNQEISDFNRAERNLKKLTQDDLAEFLSDGMDERTKVESFRRRISQYEDLLQASIMNPNPNFQINDAIENVSE